MDHRHFYKGFVTADCPLGVLRQPTRTVQPTERPLHNPTLGLNNKTNLLTHPHSWAASAMEATIALKAMDGETCIRSLRMRPIVKTLYPWT